MGGAEPPLARAPHSVQDPAGAIYIRGIFTGEGGTAPAMPPGKMAPGLLWGCALGREGTWGTPKGAPKKTQASEGGSRYPGSDPEGIPGIPGMM